MWANAQRDVRPDEYRWRPLFNAAMFGWRPLLKCRAVTLPRRESRWNFQGCPKLANRSQPLPKFTILWAHVEEVSMFNNFFPIVDTCLSCEDTARQSCAMVPKWRFFCILYFQRAACSTFQTCILNSDKGDTMCGSMVDIQSPTAEIRRGKIERKKKDRNNRAKILWSALLHRATIKQ